MINQLIEFCKYLGLIIVILILIMIIIAVLQTFFDNIRRRKKNAAIEKQFDEQITKLVEELTNTKVTEPKKTTKRKTKKDSD